MTRATSRKVPFQRRGKPVMGFHGRVIQAHQGVHGLDKGDRGG
jgi:hypothetical protein